MTRPTLRQLEYAAALAETLSFHRAAEACHASQPTLSGQIHQLEEILGVTLFERDRRKVLLTPAGREVVDRARQALALVDELMESARSMGAPLSGTLRLGVIPTLAPYVLPAAVAAAREQYPDLRILLREEKTGDLLTLLAAGKLDVLLLALEADLGSCETHALYEDPFLAVVPGDHRLAKRKRLKEADLVEETVLLLDDGHCLRDQVMPICRRVGATELGDFRASSLGTLLQMVATGLGVTLLPRLAVDHEPLDDLGVVAIPFTKPVPERTVGLAWRPTSMRAAGFGLLAELLVAARPAAARSRTMPA